MTLTDRRLRSPEDVDRVDFEKGDGLVPVIVQDASNGAVLMTAFADRESVLATLRTGEMHFWSRSRGALWRKGETSGNTQALVSLHADCDTDALLARVRPAGPACHTGERTCFGAATQGTLERLDATLADRAERRPADSYTVRLLDDENLRLKKLGEESAELVAALATGDGDRAVEEAADLLYHVLVALRAQGIGVGRVLDALEERAG